MKEYTVQDLINHLMVFRDKNDYQTQNDMTFPIARRIECSDGFSMSVQASHGAYCTPRTNLAQWDTVEVGYPTLAPVHFMSYVEDEERPTDTVYGYVPVELVVAEINSHGGAKE